MKMKKIETKRNKNKRRETTKEEEEEEIIMQISYFESYIEDNVRYGCVLERTTTHPHL